MSTYGNGEAPIAIRELNVDVPNGTSTIFTVQSDRIYILYTLFFRQTVIAANPLIIKKSYTSSTFGTITQEQDVYIPSDGTAGIIPSNERSALGMFSHPFGGPSLNLNTNDNDIAGSFRYLMPPSSILEANLNGAGYGAFIIYEYLLRSNS